MFDTGSTSFMLICTMLVLLMTPGVAFFYGGLARRKNVVNTMFMSMAIIGVVGVLWIIAGWSFAYGGDGSNPFFGGFDQLGCASVVQDMLVEAQVVPEDAVYPAIIDVVFQAAFAMITCAIIWGAVAGRMKFGAMIAFVSIWVLVIYCPLAHMVWGGEGSFIGNQIGALDFAGGDVVHISSGLAGLVLCLLLGSRKEFGTVAHRPHNIPLVVLGVTLLWFGWFGFNGGSEFAADGIAALAILNTVVASGAALLSWMVVEKIAVGKPTLVGAVTGLVAGLVVITPAAGFVEPWAAIVMGFIVSPICYFAMSVLKLSLIHILRARLSLMPSSRRLAIPSIASIFMSTASSSRISTRSWPKNINMTEARRAVLPCKSSIRQRSSRPTLQPSSKREGSSMRRSSWVTMLAA